MIRTESEYQGTLKKIEAGLQQRAQVLAELEAKGLDEESIARALGPLDCFRLNMEEEVQQYERLREGILDEVHNLHGLGELLIGLRIARGLTQKDLAERLGVHESQVSRDERDTYHGITVHRASRILDALGADLSSRVAERIRPFGADEA